MFSYTQTLNAYLFGTRTKRKTEKGMDAPTESRSCGNCHPRKQRTKPFFFSFSVIFLFPGSDTVLDQGFRTRLTEANQCWREMGLQQCQSLTQLRLTLADLTVENALKVTSNVVLGSLSHRNISYFIFCLVSLVSIKKML